MNCSHPSARTAQIANLAARVLVFAAIALEILPSAAAAQEQPGTEDAPTKAIQYETVVIPRIGVPQTEAPRVKKSTPLPHTTLGLPTPDGSIPLPTVPGLFDNLRFTLDLSSRAVYSEARDDWSYFQFIGFDLHNVFTGTHGDWGTLMLQGYLTRVDNLAPVPPLFDDGDDWEFVYRIFNFNYTGLTDGEFNLRVGHIEIPFGLEHIINTNGTLRQYIQPQNLGVKADWGAGINGVFPDWEYEAIISTGSGNELELNDGTFTAAGRIGTSRDANTAWGLSAFHGEVASPRGPNGFVRKTRAGLDVIHYMGLWGLLGEASIGRDFDADVINLIGEINWTTPDEDVLIYSQIRAFNRRTSAQGGWDDAIRPALGVLYTPDAHWSFSAEFSRDLTTFAGADRSASLALQVRYRF